MSNSWEDIKRFYVETFGVDAKLVDLVAMSDILILSVSGSSNDSISRFLNIDQEVVKEILDTVLDFDGWKEDLNLNPYSIYINLFNNDQLTSADFLKEVLAVDNVQKASQVQDMYRICSIYCSIERRIDQEWI